MGFQTLSAGAILAGKYRIEQVIGQGGFSAVYRAMHLSMNRAVAIKVLAPPRGPSDDATWSQRFSREARVISKLSNPNTITVFDHGEERGQLYLVMEFIEGRSLHEAIEDDGPMDPTRVVHIARSILNSLEEAHHYGILHRDMKPANIMISSDFKGGEVVKVLDFGIAKITHDSSVEADDLTTDHGFVGTPRYASPEQLASRPLSAASDLYGLGLIMWEMLTGRPAVPTSSIGVCLEYHLSKNPWILPGQLNIPDGLRRTIEHALLKPPSKRFQSCEEFRAHLDRWEEDGEASTVDLDDTADVPDGLDMFSGGLGVIDPNLEGGGFDALDSAPSLLLDRSASFDPDAPPPPRPATTPVPSRAFSASGPQRSMSLSSSPDLELEDISSSLSSDALKPAVAERSGDTQSAAGADRNYAMDLTPAQLDYRPRNNASNGPDLSKLIPAVGLLGVLAVAGWFVLGRAPAQPDPTTQQDPNEVTSSTANESQTPTVTLPKKVIKKPRRERFSTDGLLLVPRVAGWHPVEKSSNNLSSFQERSVIYSKKGARLDVTVLTARNDEQMAQATRIKRPARTVDFDTKRVLLIPKNAKARAELDDLEQRLIRYRALILAEQGERAEKDEAPQ